MVQLGWMRRAGERASPWPRPVPRNVPVAVPQTLLAARAQTPVSER
jgi:hypothetical protein